MKLLVDGLKNWFTPASTDPRDRTLRYLITALLLNALVSLSLSYTVYNDATPTEVFWVLVSLIPNTQHLLKGVVEPVSQAGVGIFHASIYDRLYYINWQLIHFGAILALVFSAYQTIKKRFSLASSLIIGEFLLNLAQIILFPKDTDDIVLPLAMLILLMAGLIVEKRSIFIVACVTAIIIFTTTVLQAALLNQSVWSLETLIKGYDVIYLMLLMESFILYGFRVEFDVRRNAWERVKIAELEQERLRELDKHKNEFLHSMSHELRTPLHSIIGLSSGLLNGVAGELDEELRADVVTMSNSGKHLLNLVNGLLDLAKIESGTIKLEKSHFNVANIVYSTFHMVQPQLEANNLKCINHVSPHLPLVYADPQAIQQVMLNLLNNAIKFTQQGTIEISTELDEDKLTVHIKDTGIGISEDHQSLIFDKFYQITGRYKHNEIGLGLTISKSLIKLQGGDISVKSTLGEGSTFSFSLPLNIEAP